MTSSLKLLLLTALVPLIPATVNAFDTTSPDPGVLSYRVLEGEVEGLPPMTFRLHFLGDEVTGTVTSEDTRHTAPIKGQVRADLLELTQLSALAWDSFDSEHWRFVGKVTNHQENGPLRWSGQCRSLIDGTDFVGVFEFHEVYAAGACEIEYFRFEKVASQVRNAQKDERRIGGMFPQIRDPSPTGVIVNAAIRREWYRKLTGKEPDRDLSFAELEEAVPFRLPDLSEIDDPIKSAGITHLVNATVVFNRQNLLSIQWYEFDFYGAESWPISHRFETYDLLTGKQVMLDELLEPDYDVRLAEVITEAYQNNHHAPGQREAVHRNFGKIPFERNRGNFFVTAEGSIGFGYDFMEQRYHRSGFANVPIRREQIKPILKPVTVLDRLALP